MKVFLSFSHILCTNFNINSVVLNVVFHMSTTAIGQRENHFRRDKKKYNEVNLYIVIKSGKGWSNCRSQDENIYNSCSCRIIIYELKYGKYPAGNSTETCSVYE